MGGSVHSGAAIAAVAVGLALATAAPAGVRFQVVQDRLTTQPKAMYLAGSFNGMSTSTTPMKLEGNTWMTELALPEGRHYFKYYYLDQTGKGHWMNDPVLPFLADNGKSGANNFIDVRDGKWVADTTALERFEWDRDPVAEWVCVAGDFNNWYLGQFRLAKQDNGIWLAYLPIKRPYAYKIIVDGVWKLDRLGRADATIPNGIGGRNSFRNQAVVTSPEEVTITRPIVPDDPSELDRIKAYADEADYGHAVALARRVAEVNVVARGTTAPVALKALELEGEIHKRWNRWHDAAVSWKRLADSGVITTPTLRGIRELSNYYLYILRDPEKGRFLNELAIAHAKDSVELLLILHHWYSLALRTDAPMAIESLEAALKQLPDPATQDKQYGCELSELYLIKAFAHLRLGQEEKAREAYERIIEVHPYDDGLNVIRARRWLDGYHARKAGSPR